MNFLRLLHCQNYRDSVIIIVDLLPRNLYTPVDKKLSFIKSIHIFVVQFFRHDVLSREIGRTWYINKSCAPLHMYDICATHRRIIKK